MAAISVAKNIAGIRASNHLSAPVIRYIPGSGVVQDADHAALCFSKAFGLHKDCERVHLKIVLQIVTK
jgi:hypothetical protein